MVVVGRRTPTGNQGRLTNRISFSSDDFAGRDERSFSVCNKWRWFIVCIDIHRGRKADGNDALLSRLIRFHCANISPPPWFYSVALSRKLDAVRRAFVSVSLHFKESSCRQISGLAIFGNLSLRTILYALSVQPYFVTIYIAALIPYLLNSIKCFLIENRGSVPKGFPPALATFGCLGGAFYVRGGAQPLE